MSYKRRILFNYTEEEMLQAIEEVMHGVPIATAARKWGVPRITLNDKVKGKRPEARKMGPKTVLSLEEEEILVKWVQSLASAGFPVTKQQLLTSVMELVKKLGRPNPFKDGKPGRVWFNSFLLRHPQISCRVPQNLTSSRANVSKESILSWFGEVHSYLESQAILDVIDDPSRIFNADETAFFLNPKSNKVLASRGDKNVYGIVNTDEKECITVLLNGSARGDIAPPMVVFKSTRLSSELISAVPSSWAIGRSPDSGWMTGELFYEYIANQFDTWLSINQIKRPVILFVDGHTSHSTLQLSELCAEKGIVLVALFPNATHILQPMDVAVFRTLKAGWKEERSTWRLEHIHVESGRLKRSHFCPLLEKVIAQRVTPDVLANGFRKCGLYPWNPEAVDYTKIISNGTTPIPVTQRVQEPPAEDLFLSRLEAEIGLDKLKLFKDANYGEWNVPLESKDLYYLWRRISMACSANSLIMDSIPDLDISARSPLLQETTEDNILEAQQTKAPVEGQIALDDLLSLPSTSGCQQVFMTPFENIPSPFKSTLFWPGPSRKSDLIPKRNREKIPAVASSAEWQSYYEKKEGEKVRKNEEKEERKRLREEKRLAAAEIKKMKKSKKKKRMRDIGEDSDSSVEVPELSEDEGADWNKGSSSSDGDNDDFSIGDFVIVKYNEKYYPGQINEINTQENTYLIKTMEQSGLSMYKWPAKEDKLIYERDQIVKKIQTPNLSTRRGAFLIPQMNPFSQYLLY